MVYQKGNHSYFREIISIFTSIQVKTTHTEFVTVRDLKSRSFYVVFVVFSSSKI